jgi:hypothetical protein
MTKPILQAISLSRRGLIAGALLVSAAHASELPRPASPAAPAGNVDGGNWLSGLALQAATYAAPIVAMYNLRATTTVGPDAKAPPNQIWRVDGIADPVIAAQSGYVTPNVNVIYGFGFADLSQQPIILSVPDSNGRYYMVQLVDMWTNAFAYVGGIATGYEGGTYALVGPGWEGQLPAGVKRIDCPTRWVELQPRVHVKNAADLPDARKVLHAITVTGLAQYSDGPASVVLAYNYETPKINPKVASSQMQFLDPLQFWDIFSAAMNENPPPRNEIETVLPQFKYLGIELGKTWRRENVNPIILKEMRAAAEAIGPMMLPLLPVLGDSANGWIVPTPNVGMAGADFPARAIVAVFGLTSNTPEEAIYYTAVADGSGQPLTGAKRYAITFKEQTPSIASVKPGFWSITVYDSRTGFTVSNSIGRYALGSDDTLSRDTDGGFTLHLQSDNPGADQASNWLPIPAGPFYLIIRVYAPSPATVAALENPTTFQGPPPVQPIG